MFIDKLNKCNFYVKKLTYIKPVIRFYFVKMENEITTTSVLPLDNNGDVKMEDWIEEEKPGTIEW